MKINRKKAVILLLGMLIVFLAGILMGKVIFSGETVKERAGTRQGEEYPEAEGGERRQAENSKGDEGQTSGGEGQTSRDEGQTSGDEGQTSREEGQTSRDEGQTSGDEGQNGDQLTENSGEEENSSGGSSKSMAESGVMTIYDIEDGYMQVPYLESLSHHAYDWSKLHEKNGFSYYIDEDGAVSKIGIDVSYFQNEIDWKQVKASGIDFAILRVGYRGYSEEGKLVVDEKFHQYMKEAKEAGLETGVYFFSQAINEGEAVEEAEFVIQQCKDYEITCPVVFDTEKIKDAAARTDGLQPKELTDITIAFCEKINEYGYTPMIYANAKWLTTKLQLERLQDYEIWYADYQPQPLYPYEFSMWQYTESGSVDGIEGNVDLNIWFRE